MSLHTLVHISKFSKLVNFDIKHSQLNTMKANMEAKVRILAVTL